MKNKICTTYLIRIVFYSLLAIVFVSCNKYSEITTESECTSYCNQLYTVKVCTWVRDRYGYPIALEYYENRYDVPAAKIDSVTKALMPGAVACKNKIDNCLKSQ